MKSKITPEQEKIVDTIHNLVWHRITHDDYYLKAIPEIGSADFHEYIYYIRYDFIEYEDSGIQAVVYLNGQHYEYFYLPQSLKIICVDELKDSEVEETIKKIYSGKENVDEFFRHFELFGPETVPEGASRVFYEVEKKSTSEEDDYDDLPF
jgi:hypothetical protein